jgi:hypothetical protein
MTRRPGHRGSIPDRGNRFFLQRLCPDQLWGPTQLPVQWVPWVLSTGLRRDRGVTLTTHTHLMPKSWMNRSYTSSPPLHIHRCVVGLLYLCLVRSCLKQFQSSCYATIFANGLLSGVCVIFHGVRKENKPRRPSADITYIFRPTHAYIQRHFSCGNYSLAQRVIQNSVGELWC